MTLVDDPVQDFLEIFTNVGCGFRIICLITSPWIFNIFMYIYCEGFHQRRVKSTLFYSRKMTESVMTASESDSQRKSDSKIAEERQVTLTDELLAKLTARKRAILKLRTGTLLLTDAELAKVPPANRTAAIEIKPRTLQEVADLFEVTRERIRQIENGCLERLELEWTTDRTGFVKR